MSDRGPQELVEMTTEECSDLLSRHSVGRLAVLSAGRPMIYPVNYVIDGEEVVFRNDPGAKLTSASLDPVAFEVDEISEADHAGASVVVQGVAVEITDALDEASTRARGLELRPWVNGDKFRWVRITRSVITGRRLQPPG